MTDFQMRWPDSPHAEVAPGWTKVLTPLGADIHVLINSPAWDVCTEWQLLHSGRGLLSPTDPLDWFSNAELAEMPQGLVAELFAHASRVQAYTRLIVANAEARAHMLRLPDNVYGAEPEDWAHIATYVDIARCLDCPILPSRSQMDTGPCARSTVLRAQCFKLDESPRIP